MTSNRRVFLHVVLACGGAVMMIVACSSDDRPPGVGTSSSSSSGAVSTTSSSSSSTSSGGSFEGGSPIDGATPEEDGSSSGGPVDSGPPFECVDDKSLSNDAGALPTSCPESASCSAHCTNIAKNFKLAIAQTAIACLRKLPSCNTKSDVQACVDDAVADVCADATSKGYCTPLVTGCDPNAGGVGSSIDQAGCESLANALTSAGRTTFKDCIDEKINAGNCPTEVISCANDIRL